MQSVNSSNDIVFFGALGDLSQRKLIPALYQLERAGQLATESRIIGVARKSYSDDEFKAHCHEQLREFVAQDELIEDVVTKLLKRFSYHRIDFSVSDGFGSLADQLNQFPDRGRVYYFATAASQYGVISEQLDEFKLITDNSRVVLEKPIGHSLTSSEEVNDVVGKHFKEQQIYRIDHYLGKETVQNLLMLRFANPVFSTIWNNQHISHIEISVTEKVGIEGRWGYFDDAGQLRDMVQNHLFQLLMLTAMPTPISLRSDDIRDAKVSVLKSLRPFDPYNADKLYIRGQYQAGTVDGKSVPGYLEEDGANTDSLTESFVALKLHIDNEQWKDVPFFLRTGKRLKSKSTRIVVHFKPQHALFGEQENQLVIQLQPDEGITLQIYSKENGLTSTQQLRRDNLQLNILDQNNDRIADAYERLLLEVCRGNQALFVRRDEVEFAWRWCDQLLAFWQYNDTQPEGYAAGSWGPDSATNLMTRHGKHWYGDNDA